MSWSVSLCDATFLWYWGTNEIEINECHRNETKQTKMEFTNDIVQIYILENISFSKGKRKASARGKPKWEIAREKDFNPDWEWFFNKLSSAESCDAKAIYVFWILFWNARGLAFTLAQGSACDCVWVYGATVCSGLSFIHTALTPSRECACE